MWWGNQPINLSLLDSCILWCCCVIIFLSRNVHSLVLIWFEKVHYLHNILFLICTKNNNGENPVRALVLYFNTHTHTHTHTHMSLLCMDRKTEQELVVVTKYKKGLDPVVRVHYTTWDIGTGLTFRFPMSDFRHDVYETTNSRSTRISHHQWVNSRYLFSYGINSMNTGFNYWI